MLKIIQVYTQSKWLRFALQVLLFVVIFYAINAWRSSGSVKGVAPIVLGATLSGEVFDLREQRGKPILLHFWATWCPVCQFENANIAAIAEDYPVITIASWSESAQQVKAYMQGEQLNMPVIVDEDGEWAKVYGVTALPTSFLIDATGEVRFVETGYSSELGLRARLWWLH